MKKESWYDGQVVWFVLLKVKYVLHFGKLICQKMPKLLAAVLIKN
jgi:hypothetical protein